MTVRQGLDAFRRLCATKALHHAARKPRHDRWELPPLVAAGADTEARDRLGRTAMGIALEEGTDETAAQLASLGADPLAAFGPRWERIGNAKAAALACMPLTLDAVLSAGHDPDDTDEDGLTVLHYAAYSGHGPTVAVALSHGADVGARDLMGDTPMHIAATATAEAVMAIHCAGGDANARNAFGETPAHKAASGVLAYSMLSSMAKRLGQPHVI